MSAVIDANPWTPDDALLAELGRVTLRHAQLEHALKLTLKRMFGISLNDRGYYDRVGKLMSRDLRDKISEAVDARLGQRSIQAQSLRQMLPAAERLTSRRNRVAHGNWVIKADGQTLIRDRARSYPIPTAADLRELADGIYALAQTFEAITRTYLGDQLVAD